MGFEEAITKSSQEVEQIINPTMNILAAVITLVLGLIIARASGKLLSAL